MNTELNSKQWTELVEKLRKPQVLFPITAGAAILILIVLYIQLVYPVQARIDAADRAIAEMRALKEQAELLPVPEQLTESMVTEVGEMLPPKPEAAALLNSLRTIEIETGTEILALQRTEAQEPETAQANLSASEGQMQDFLEAVDTEGEARVVTVGSGLTEMRYELVAQGEYARLLKFMDSLRHAKRIIRVGEWKIASLSDPSAEQSSEARTNNYELTVTMSFYYTDQFASLFDTAVKE
jgi:type II secretory pathway component PulM